MPKAKKAPLAERAPLALEELGHATAAEMLAYLGIKAGDVVGRNQVFRILWELVAAGRAAVMPDNLAAGWFWVQARPRRHDLQARTCRALAVRQKKYGGFTRSDLLSLTGAKNRDYTRRLLAYWQGLGLLLLTGETRDGEPVYQLAPGAAVSQLPHWNRRAEKRKRSAGRDAGGHGQQAVVAQSLAGVGNFISEARQILGEANVRVTAVLDGMEMDLSSLIKVVEGSEAG